MFYSRKQLWRRTTTVIAGDVNDSPSRECGGQCDLFALLQPLLSSLSGVFPGQTETRMDSVISATSDRLNGDSRKLLSASVLEEADVELASEEVKAFKSRPTNDADFRKSNTMPRLRSALSMNDLQAALRPKDREKRRARFSSTVHVCLVPTRAELQNIFDDLYFRSDDFTTFKREAVLELREVLTGLGITSKQAIQYMYQPQSEGGGGVVDVKHASEYDHGPSMSDDEAEEADVFANPPRMGHANNMGGSHILIEVEGPSLSDDEEETQAYKAKIDDNLRAASFITGAKTDIELNAHGLSKSKVIVNSAGNSVRVLPSVTPSGATSEAHATWQVQWKGPDPNAKYAARDAMKKSIKVSV